MQTSHPPALRKWLASLRDLDGIVGSFIVNAEGDVLESDQPSEHHFATEGVGDRLVRLRDVISLASGEVSTITLRFPNHKLAIRAMTDGLLVVVTTATVNDAALRTAMNLLAQKCPSLPSVSATPHNSIPVESVDRESAPTVVSARPRPEHSEADEDRNSSPPDRISAPPEAGVAAPSRKPRAVFFRGKRIG